jgi:hypothetical protein
LKTLLFILAVISFLLTAGCQQNVTLTTAPAILTQTVSQGEIVPITSSPSTESNDGTGMPSPTVTPDSSAQTMVQIAMANLAEKLKISVNQIYLSSIEAVTWPDTSLGCPQMGIMYIQVLTPGFNILLEAQGKTYSFHTDEIERVILCDIRAPDEIFLPP